MPNSTWTQLRGGPHIDFRFAARMDPDLSGLQLTRSVAPTWHLNSARLRLVSAYLGRSRLRARVGDHSAERIGSTGLDMLLVVSLARDNCPFTVI